MSAKVSREGCAEASRSTGCSLMKRFGSLSWREWTSFYGCVFCNLYTIYTSRFGRLFPILTAKIQYNLTNAREYFEEHLRVGDYFDEGQRVAGQWVGVAAEDLGLSGKVRADAFLRLCENQHPATDETLTQRLNTVRMNDGKEAANRRVFYDFIFSPPKSVSVVPLAVADERIIEAHRQAVRSAIRELESYAATRVRCGGGHGDRSIGNVVAFGHIDAFKQHRVAFSWGCWHGQKFCPARVG
jgi:hypothetical protein